jgi:hypothetical protein
MHTIHDPEATRNSESVCFTCGYTIEIRLDNMGLPGRQYIWEGGQYTQEEIDQLKEEHGSDSDLPEVGDDWCFVYGEGEWLSPGEHPVTEETLDWEGYLDLASSDMDRRELCQSE